MLDPRVTLPVYEKIACFAKLVTAINRNWTLIMKTYLDCFPCLLNQALQAGRIATGDEKKIKRLLDEVGRMFEKIPLKSTPPESANLVYQKVREITGNIDPYKELKIESTQKALTLYPSLKRHVEESKDKLLIAIRIAIAGNVMDFGANKTFDIDKEIKEALNKDFGICDYSTFSRCLDETRDVLFIGDNAGECVFDRILIEQMDKPTIYAVRSMPVINDATYQDAVDAGIDKIATILSSGTSAPGTILKTCNTEFKKVYRKAKLIISKGQGNYEALSNEKHPIFFLLKAKCKVIANDIGVNKGDILLKKANIL